MPDLDKTAKAVNICDGQDGHAWSISITLHSETHGKSITYPMSRRSIGDLVADWLSVEEESEIRIIKKKSVE